jgi:hypothetical protein
MRRIIEPGIETLPQKRRRIEMRIKDALQMAETAVHLRRFAQTGRLTAVRHAGPSESLSLDPDEQCFAVVRLERTKLIKHLVGPRRLFLPMLCDELGATAMFEYLENTDGTAQDRRAGIHRHMTRWLRIAPAWGTS